MGIKKFVESVLSNKSNKLQKYSLGKLTYQQMKQVKEATGIDLRNCKRIIDSYGIKHILKNHGDHKIEKLRGQIAVTPDDFQKINEIVLRPDKIESVENTKQGEILIKFTKRIIIEFVYVEEKRKKELVTKTMYKKNKETLPSVQMIRPSHLTP